MMSEQFTCPDCNGQGWYPVPVSVTRCCGGSDWECGGRGCTGPVQDWEQEQEQCERCFATGDVRARDSDRSGEAGETPLGGSTEGESAGRNAASPTPSNPLPGDHP